MPVISKIRIMMNFAIPYKKFPVMPVSILKIFLYFIFPKGSTKEPIDLKKHFDNTNNPNQYYCSLPRFIIGYKLADCFEIIEKNSIERKPITFLSDFISAELLKSKDSNKYLYKEFYLTVKEDNQEEVHNKIFNFITEYIELFKQNELDDGYFTDDTYKNFLKYSVQHKLFEKYLNTKKRYTGAICFKDEDITEFEKETEVRFFEMLFISYIEGKIKIKNIFFNPFFSVYIRFNENNNSANADNIIRYKDFEIDTEKGIIICNNGERKQEILRKGYEYFVILTTLIKESENSEQAKVSVKKIQYAIKANINVKKPLSNNISIKSAVRNLNKKLEAIGSEVRISTSVGNKSKNRTNIKSREQNIKYLILK